MFGLSMDGLKVIVRPILTIMGFSALTYGFLVSKIEANTYVPIVSMMVAFWFGNRNPNT